MADGVEYGYDQYDDKTKFKRAPENKENESSQPPDYSPPIGWNTQPANVQQPGQYPAAHQMTQFPVIQQPQHSTSSTTVVVQQPQQQIKMPRNWSSGVCSCFDDMGICLCGTFCTCCLSGQVVGDMGEHCCVPWCVPGWLVALRLKMRTQEMIPGSLIDDCCVVCCCPTCALCQLARELRYVQLRNGANQANRDLGNAL